MPYTSRREASFSTPAVLRLAATALVVLAACSSTENSPGTRVHFRSSDALVVPAGATLHVLAWRNGQRMHEAPTDLGTFPFEENIFVEVGSSDDASRRFTLFAELLAGDQRISWARVRSGFVNGESASVNVTLGEGCLEPADRPQTGFDSAATCGSFDTCDGSGACRAACVAPSTDNDGETATAYTDCPATDCRSVDEIAVGRNMTCALSDGEGYCWGRLAKGFTAWDNHPRRPTRIVGAGGVAEYENNIVSIDVTSEHACLVTDDGSLRCGGRNSGTNLQIGPAQPDVRPCCELDLDRSTEPLVDVVVSTNLTITVDRLGAVGSIGRNVATQSPNDGWLPVFGGSTGHDRVLGLWDDVCAFRSGNFACVLSSFPAEGPRVITADSAVDTLCVVRESGQLTCFGKDIRGDFAEEPHVVPGNWSSVSVARQFIGDDNAFCAIDTESQISCWGEPAGGRTGTNSLTTETAPSQVGVGQNWSQVGLGQEHACAVNEAGIVHCWGSNALGQLGRDGPDSLDPQPVCIPAF